MQQSIFSENDLPKSIKTALVISKAGKKALSKNQQEFNKLTSRIEKLQKEIAKKQDKFDMAMKVYGTDLFPLKNELIAERKQNLMLLWQHYKEKRLSQKDQKTLKVIISELLETIFEELSTEPDDEIKEIFKDIEGDDLNDIMKQEEDEMKHHLKEALKNAKIDITDIDLDDIGSLQRKIFEHNAQQNHEDKYTNQKQTTKKKSAKQLEAEKIHEAAEELKKKNISTIYKQLAKLFHPDLEQDEERKAEKMLLMQELTAAYETKNLHALLTLELKWIHKENDHLESLTEEKLGIYLQILKEQIQELDEQKHSIIYQSKYAVLVEEFGWQVKQAPLEIVNKNVTQTAINIKKLRNNSILFKSENALRHIKQMIKDWKAQEQAYDADDELFDMLFGR